MLQDQADIIAFLSDPATYDLPGETIETQATHGSMVFLAGERAFKLKRAVRLPYLDYSTAERRRAMCEAELAVNRGLAPEIYLGLAAIVRGADGTLRIDQTGRSEDAADWLVVMRRFRQSALFDAMRSRGALDTALMRRLGERIAAFHASAEPRPQFGGARGIAEVVEENRSMLGRAAGRPFDPGKIAALDALTRDAFAAQAKLLEDRRAGGLVRRCHGDLHLNNICLYDGEPVPFDAIEFQDSFACIDVLLDLALLLVDLDRHGLRGFANIVLNRYLEVSGDYSGLAALPLFLSCRAALRAHILVAMAESGKAASAPERLEQAAHLLDCAIRYLEPAECSLTAIGGLSGSGKSTVAAALAPHLGRAPGAIVLRTDVLRKALWGVDERTPLPAEAYADSFTERVYRTLAERAAQVLNCGHCVIADGVFGRERERAQIAGAANGARFEGFWLDAPAQLLEQRVLSRRNDASDATPEVLHDQLARIVPPQSWTIIAAQSGADSVVERVLAARQRVIMRKRI